MTPLEKSTGLFPLLKSLGTEPLDRKTLKRLIEEATNHCVALEDPPNPPIDYKSYSQWGLIKAWLEEHLAYSEWCARPHE